MQLEVLHCAWGATHPKGFVVDLLCWKRRNTYSLASLTLNEKKFSTSLVTGCLPRMNGGMPAIARVRHCTSTSCGERLSGRRHYHQYLLHREVLFAWDFRWVFRSPAVKWHHRESAGTPGKAGGRQMSVRARFGLMRLAWDYSRVVAKDWPILPTSHFAPFGRVELVR
jgi:hypothetical protein